MIRDAGNSSPGDALRLMLHIDNAYNVIDSTSDSCARKAEITFPSS
jgi:hypothetical protein